MKRVKLTLKRKKELKKKYGPNWKERVKAIALATELNKEEEGR